MHIPRMSESAKLRSSPGLFGLAGGRLCLGRGPTCELGCAATSVPMSWLRCINDVSALSAAAYLDRVRGRNMACITNGKSP